MSKEKDDAPQLSEYANKLDPLVKKRYMQKIACSFIVSFFNLLYFYIDFSPWYWCNYFEKPDLESNIIIIVIIIIIINY